MKLASLILLLLAAQTLPKEVPVSQEPSHHLVLENQYTRTYQVEVAPGASTLLHRHDHDYLFVVIGDAHISNEVAGKPAVEQKLKNGDVKFASGGFAHVARNLASTPFRTVTIEVLRKTSKVVAPFGDAFFHEHLTHDMVSGSTLLGETDVVRVWGVGLGERSRVHRSRAPHLIVALKDLHLKDEMPGKPSTDIQMKPGDVHWAAAGQHTLTNVGPEGASFVIVEFR